MKFIALVGKVEFETQMEDKVAQGATKVYAKEGCYFLYKILSSRSNIEADRIWSEAK